MVTKDIPAYSIVGGVPARVLRKRFDDQKIAQLLDGEWWNLSDSALAHLAQAFRDDGNWSVDELKSLVSAVIGK